MKNSIKGILKSSNFIFSDPQSNALKKQQRISFLIYINDIFTVLSLKNVSTTLNKYFYVFYYPKIFAI